MAVNSPPNQPPKAQPELRTATRWHAVGKGVEAGLRYLVVIVVTSMGWFDSQDWGLFEGAMLVTGLVELFIELGTGQAIVQRKDLDEGFLASMFWFNLLIGLSVGALVYWLAQPLAGALGVPGSAGPLRLMALSFPLGSLGINHRSQLVRDLRFGRLAGVNSFSALAYAGTALVLASEGHGPNALALALLVAVGTRTLGMWIARPWRPRVGPRFRDLREISGFSGGILGSQVAGFLLQRADRFLVARFLGAEDLGVLGLAHRVMVQPARMVSMIATGTLMPALSRVKEDPASFARLYRRSLEAVAFLSMPILVGVAVTADLLLSLKGKGTVELGSLIPLLLPYAMVMGLLMLAGPVYVARARTGTMFRMGVVLGTGILAAELAGLLTLGTVESVAAGLSLGMVLLMPWTLGVPCRLAGLSLREVLEGPLRALALALLMGGAVLLLRARLEDTGLGPDLQLLLSALLGASLYTMLALWLRPRGLEPALRLLGLGRLAASHHVPS